MTSPSATDRRPGDHTLTMARPGWRSGGSVWPEPKRDLSPDRHYSCPAGGFLAIWSHGGTESDDWNQDVQITTRRGGPAPRGICLAGSISARADTLKADRTFGKGGVATPGIPGGANSAPFGLARTPDGKIVQSLLTMEGRAGLVVQYTKRGRLDPAFGGHGIVGLDFGGLAANPRDLIVGKRGNILVTGEGSSGETDLYGTALVSLRPDGRPNPNFAGGGVALPQELEGVTPNEMTFDHEGRVVIVGHRGGMPAANTVVARFRSGGKLDDSFAGDGVKVFPVARNQLGRTVAVDDNGRIVVGSPGGAPYRHEHYIVRLLPNGRFDRTFGRDGRRVVNAVKGHEEIADLAIDGRNGILIAGRTRSREGAVTRLFPGGGIDRTFGRRGTARLPWFSPRSLVVSRRGSVFVLGSDEYAGGEIAWLGPKGKSNGSRFFAPRTRQLYDGFLDRQGRLVAGGSSSERRLAVVRLQKRR